MTNQLGAAMLFVPNQAETKKKRVKGHSSFQGPSAQDKYGKKNSHTFFLEKKKTRIHDWS